MEIRHIIFDFDGTLVNTQKAIANCILLTLEQKTLPSPDEVFVKQLVGAGLNLGDTFSKLGIVDQELDEFKKLYREIYSKESEKYAVLFDGIKDGLDLLKENSKDLILFSNKGREAVIKALEFFGIKDYFTHIVAETPGLSPKPSPEIFEKVIFPLFPGASKEDFLMIGDTHADIEFAKNAGIKSCWVTYGFGDPKKCKLLIPDITIADITNINTYLDITLHGN